MEYEKIVVGRFIERPNRFVAIVEADGKIVEAHVKNTGRCRELLLPNAKVYLEDFEGRMNTRKLRYSIVGVEKNTNHGILLINMDSNAPNKVVLEALRSEQIKLEGIGMIETVKAEKSFGNSRFDVYVEDADGNKGFVEVKGVTLEENGIALFPDAPTERGLKHVKELVNALHAGYNAYIIFVIQMSGMGEFMPNDKTHEAFGTALREAHDLGVKILAYECSVTSDSLRIEKPVRVNLD